MNLKICIIGQKQSGKSSLANYLTPNYWDSGREPVGNEPRIRRFVSENKKITLDFFEIPFEGVGQIFSINTAFFIYCIDLSQDLDDETLESIKKDLSRREAENKEAYFIIAATKCDLELPDNLSQIQQWFATYPVIATSTVNQGDENQVYEFLSHFIISKFKRTLDKFSSDSKMYMTLEKFMIEIREEPFPLRYALVNEAETLVRHLLNPNEIDKASHIQAFYDNCNELVSKDSKLEGLLQTLAFGALIFVLAGVIGFFIGFTLGAWSGPGAFFTGLVGGMLSAILVVVAASMVAVGAVSFCAHRVFKKTAEEEAINEIHEEAKLML